MTTMFLSYSRETQQQVESLAQDIHAMELRVWFDRELTGGQAWWDQILKQIRECDYFVFALAPESLDSTACKREYGYAASLGKTILPILIADGVITEMLPATLAQVHFVDYRRQDKDAWRALSRALHTLPASAPLPDPLPVPPPVPVSYLGELKEQIDTPSPLGFDQQTGLLLRLKQAIGDARDADNARQLLLRFRARADLYARVADEIDLLLRTAPATPPGRTGVGNGDARHATLPSPAGQGIATSALAPPRAAPATQPAQPTALPRTAAPARIPAQQTAPPESGRPLGETPPARRPKLLIWAAGAAAVAILAVIVTQRREQPGQFQPEPVSNPPLQPEQPAAHEPLPHQQTRKSVTWHDHALRYSGTLAMSATGQFQMDITVWDLRTSRQIGIYNVPVIASAQGGSGVLIGGSVAVPGDSVTPTPHEHLFNLFLQKQQDDSLSVVQNCPRIGECYAGQ